MRSSRPTRGRACSGGSSNRNTKRATPAATPSHGSGRRTGSAHLKTSPSGAEKKSVGRRKRLPHMWDRRFRLSTRRSQRPFSTSHGRGLVPNLLGEETLVADFLDLVHLRLQPVDVPLFDFEVAFEQFP